MQAPFTGKLFVISAPTGGGKTTVARRVLQQIGNLMPISKVITYTTRQPRSNELPDIDYHFVTAKEFLAKKEQGFFLETTTYDTAWYGSPASIKTDLAKGKSFIMVTDRPGACVLKTLVPEAVLIWITVPSPAVIAQRLEQRGTESAEQLKRRLALATQEITIEREEPIFAYHVVNDNLETTANEVIAIISSQTGYNLTKQSPAF
jgi:guanylate kinase